MGKGLAHIGLSVPEAVPTLSGHDFVNVTTDKIMQPRQVELMAWVDGKQIGSVEAGLDDDAEETRQIYLTMGRVAAQIHNQAIGWSLPSEFERHSWDVEGLLGEEPFWGRFWELSTLTNEQKILVTEARSALRAD